MGKYWVMMGLSLATVLFVYGASYWFMTLLP